MMKFISSSALARHPSRRSSHHLGLPISIKLWKVALRESSVKVPLSDNFSYLYFSANPSVWGWFVLAFTRCKHGLEAGLARFFLFSIILSAHAFMELRSGQSDTFRFAAPPQHPSPSSVSDERPDENLWPAIQNGLPIRTSNSADWRSRGQSVGSVANIKSIESPRKTFDSGSSDGKFPTTDDSISVSADRPHPLASTPKYPTAPEDESGSFEYIFEPPQVHETLDVLTAANLPHCHRLLSDIAVDSGELTASTGEEDVTSALFEAFSESNDLLVEERPEIPLPEEFPTYIPAEDLEDEALTSWLPAGIDTCEDLQGIYIHLSLF